MPSKKMREFIEEAYSRSIQPSVIAKVTGLDARYVSTHVYKQGLREVRDMMQEDEALELAEELEIDLEAERQFRSRNQEPKKQKGFGQRMQAFRSYIRIQARGK